MCENAPVSEQKPQKKVNWMQGIMVVLYLLIGAFSAS